MIMHMNDAYKAFSNEELGKQNLRCPSLRSSDLITGVGTEGQGAGYPRGGAGRGAPPGRRA